MDFILERNVNNINSRDLTTLKEAMAKNNWLHYNKQLREDCLGVVQYNNEPFCDYYEFIPVVFNGYFLRANN